MSHYAQEGKPFLHGPGPCSTVLLTHSPVQKATQELCSLSQTEVYVGLWVQSHMWLLEVMDVEKVLSTWLCHQ